jgi:hypothetical protein
VRFRRGHAARVVPLGVRFWSKVRKGEPDACWEWTAGRFSTGYGAFLVDYQNRGAHRIAWELSNGETVPAGKVVCHRCDNPPCCNPGHLFLGLPADNTADMLAKDRQVTPGPTVSLKGESQPEAKLTDDDVRDIRQRVGSVTQRAMAQEYGVSESTISLVVLGKHWKHVT